VATATLRRIDLDDAGTEFPQKSTTGRPGESEAQVHNLETRQRVRQLRLGSVYGRPAGQVVELSHDLRVISIGQMARLQRRSRTCGEVDRPSGHPGRS